MTWIQDVHSYKIAEIPFEFIGTIGIAAIIAHYFNYCIVAIIIIITLISIPFHYWFGICTYTNYYVGLDDEPNHCGHPASLDKYFG